MPGRSALVSAALTAATVATASSPAPLARPDAVTIASGAGPTLVRVLDNDDAGSPGSRLSVVAVTQPAHGTVAIAAGGLGVVYTPAAGFTGRDTFTYTASNALQAVRVPSSIIGEYGGTPILDGYGSALAPIPGAPDEFYLLTDRGPTVDGPSGTKIVALKSFTPHIGRFRLADGALSLLSTIVLKDADGHPRSGLDEANGIDAEGLVALPDGTFWISDEYGPYLLHVDGTGRTLEQVSPHAANARGHKLPAVLARRVSNKGMEGLTVTPDGLRLVGIMQASLANGISEREAKSTPTVRIVTYDLAGRAEGTTHQYLYLLDDPATTGVGVSEIAAVSNTELLVDERDARFPGDPENPSRVKRLYRISLDGATDVSDAGDPATGRLVRGSTIEALTAGLTRSAARDRLREQGIAAVSKTLEVDLLAELSRVGALGTLYPHDKIEGLAVVDSGRRIVLSNDNDFGVDGTRPPSKRLVAKTIPTPPRETDYTSLLIVDLANLPATPATATVTVSVGAPAR